MAVVELLDEPGQPAGAALGDDDLELRMALEDAPGEQVDKRFEEIRHEEFGVLEHACRLAGSARVAIAEYRDVPRKDDPGFLKRRPQLLPSRVVKLGIDVGDHQRDLPHPAFGGKT